MSIKEDFTHDTTIQDNLTEFVLGQIKWRLNDYVQQALDNEGPCDLDELITNVISYIEDDDEMVEETITEDLAPWDLHEIAGDTITDDDDIDEAFNEGIIKNRELITIVVNKVSRAIEDRYRDDIHDLCYDALESTEGRLGQRGLSYKDI